MIKVGLSTGHSKLDSGAIGIGGIKENDLNLALVNMIMAFNLGAGYFYRSDLSAENLPKGKALQKTIACINYDMPLGAIEIHHNANINPDVYGCWLLYWSQNPQSKIWARCIETHMQLALPKVKVVDETWCGNKRDGFLRGVNVPPIVFEGGFITNKSDLELIVNRRLYVAYAIRQGTIDWLNQI